MVFNQRSCKALALGFAAVSLASCLELGPRVDLSQTSGISAGDTACLDGVGKTVQDYWAGQIEDPARIDALWSCLSDSLDLFAARVTGAQPGIYTANEVRLFATKYFIKNAVISDDLLFQAMQLKAALVGGTAASVTLAELQQTKQWIQVFHRQSLLLYPFLPYLKGITPLTDDAYPGVAAALQSLASDLGQTLQSSGVSLSFQNITSLLTDLSTYVSDPLFGQNLAHLSSQVSGAALIKNDLFGGALDAIASNEWPMVATRGAQVLALTLRARVLSSYSSIILGQGREHMIALATDSLDLLANWLAQMPDATLYFDEIDGLIDALQLTGLPVQTSTLKGVVKAAVTRLFGGQDGGVNGRDAPGINLANLARIRATLVSWSDKQMYLEGLFDALATLPGHDNSNGEGYTPGDLLSVKLDDLFGGMLTDDPVMIDASIKMRALITNDRPLFEGEDSEIFFPTHPGDRLSLHNLTIMALFYEATQAILNGYVNMPSSAGVPYQATFAEFQSFYMDFRQLGIEMKILGPTADALVSQRFKEANLFTYAANGDGYMSLSEGAQMAADLFSAKSLSSRIYKELAGVCPNSGLLDPYGYPRLDYACYRKSFFERVDHFWDRMPVLLAYYKGLSVGQQATFADTFLLAAVSSSMVGQPLGTGDTDGVAMISHYIEATFARFDTDFSGTLDVKETPAAFPVFESTLQLASGYTDPSMLYGLFTYLLNYGHPPSKDAGGLASFGWWMFTAPGWSYHADRMTLLEIFATLGSSAH